MASTRPDITLREAALLVAAALFELMYDDPSALKGMARAEVLLDTIQQRIWESEEELKKTLSTAPDIN